MKRREQLIESRAELNYLREYPDSNWRLAFALRADVISQTREQVLPDEAMMKAYRDGAERELISEGKIEKAS